MHTYPKHKSSVILNVDHVSKTFQSGSSELTVLRDVQFELMRGETCAIVGPSGSGKTTLLGLCAGLDTPSSGSVSLNGREISAMTEQDLSEVRRREIGFVFQAFQLIQTLTAAENVMVPLELAGASYNRSREKALELLGEVGLANRTEHYPTQLSGGEQQRVGLARAFIHEPEILFADEPTGNLDGETGHQIEHLLFELNQKKGTTLVIVTHDRELAEKCDRVISLKDGQIISDAVVQMQKAT
jgi:putative ABC transport system ATP-binding protein